MANNLSVAITADVTDLQVKFAVARAQVNGLTSELNKLAKASAAGTIDAGGSARMQQLAGDLISARSAAGAYADGMAKAGVSISGFGHSMEASRGSIANAAFEFRMLFSEISRGEGTRADVTLAKIATHLLEFSPIMVGATLGIGALAAGLGYLAVRSIEASNALDKIKLGADFAGNLDISRQSIKQFADEMSKAANISSSDARKIEATFASMPDTSAEQLHALTQRVSDFATVTGQESTKAAEQLAKMFEGKESAAEVAKALGGMTQAQINAASATDKSGDAIAVFVEKASLIDAVIKRSTTDIDEQKSSVSSFTTWWQHLSAAIIDSTNAEQTHAIILADVNKEREKQIALQQQVMASMPKQSQEQTLKTGVATAEKENPVALQIEEAKSKVSEMTAALTVAQQRADRLSIDKLTAGLEKAREELSNLKFGPALERMRTDMAQVASSWDGTQSGMLEKQRQIAAKSLADVSQGSKEYLAVQQEMARLSVQIRQSEGTEAVAAARTEVSQISAETQVGGVQRLQLESNVWAQVLAGDRLTAAQRVDVQRSLNQMLAESAKEVQAQAQSIARQDADTRIAISRLTLDAEKSSLDAGVVNTQTAADRKLAVLKDLANKEYGLDLQQLQNELKSLQDQPVEEDRVNNQILELQAKHQLDMTKLDKDGAAERARLAKEQVTEWQKAVGEIENAESTLVSDLINKRKTLSQSLLQVSSQLIQQELANDVKAMTTRLLLANTEQMQTKALEQGGFLYHEFVEMMKTRNTAQSQMAQTAASLAGDAARTSSTVASAASSHAVGAMAGSKTVMQDAAKAFSGTYASVAQIPYVGWILAPIAAGAAFAAVAGYETMASLDVGAWNVPGDMVAQIHKGETVVPANFAEGMRQGGGGFGGGDTHHHWSINAMDAQSFDRFLKNGGGNTIAKHLTRYVQNNGPLPHK